MSLADRRTVAAALSMLLAAALGPGPRSAPAPQVPARPAPAPQVPDDDDEAAFREAMVRRSLQENCLICHTEDMIAGQRLTAAQWNAEVEKMVNWGAPLPKEAASPLIEYLAQRYSDRSPPPTPKRAALKEVDSLEISTRDRGAVPAYGDPARGERLYAAQCATCHGPTALGGDLGPCLVGKAILDHPREYDRIMRQGLRRMPGFEKVLSENDQVDILAWLRRRAYPEPSVRGGL